MSADVPSQVTPPVTSASPAGTARQSVRLPPRRIRFGHGVPGAGRLLASRIVLGLAVALTLMIAALAAGSRLDDRQIDRHLGTATATVLSISALHTGIEFVDGGGVTIRPPDGVLYPGLLSVGQMFEIQYSTIDPTLVRVAGRTAAVGNLVLGIALAVTWLVALLARYLMRRRPAALRRRGRRRSKLAPTEPGTGRD